MISLMLFYILLGAVMDELAMILLTLPVFFPIVQALDFGMPADEVAIWFGILVLIVVGIGLTAPPIGLNVFVISSIAKTVPIASTYRGVLPFIFTDIIRLGLVLAFPGLALWLVRLLKLMRRLRLTNRQAWSREMAKKGYWIAHVNITNPGALQGLCRGQCGSRSQIQRAFSGAQRQVARFAEGQLGGRRHAVIEFDSYARPRPATIRRNIRRRPRSAMRPARPISSSSRATRASLSRVP